MAEAVPSTVEVAQLFHENYERLAPQHGYKTREASAVPWDEVPENNRSLMIATCQAVLDALSAAGYVIVPTNIEMEAIEVPGTHMVLVDPTDPESMRAAGFHGPFYPGPMWMAPEEGPE